MPQNAAIDAPCNSARSARFPLVSSKCVGAWATSHHTASGASRLARLRISSRRLASIKLARVRQITSARRSELAGSRNVPRGNTWSNPKGAVASRRTMSRSRCSRRCWNPSSSNKTSAWCWLIACLAISTRLGDCRCGTSGKAWCNSFASSFSPPPSERYPRLSSTTFVSDSRSCRAIHFTSGVFPVPPSVKLPTEITGTSTRTISREPASNARFRELTTCR